MWENEGWRKPKHPADVYRIDQSDWLVLRVIAQDFTLGWGLATLNEPRTEAGQKLERCEYPGEKQPTG